MSQKRFYRIPSLLLILAAIVGVGACRSETSGTPEGLIVINAPVSGKVRRILVAENSIVRESATILEIAVVSNAQSPANNENRQTSGGVPNAQTEMITAEEELQRASVEMQRLEPLVAAGSAPQAHLDAARAQYQQAQERVDALRRAAENPQSNPAARQNAVAFGQTAPPSENIINVPAPVAGNVRVISVRVGQTVKAGDAVATISTAR